MKTIINVGQKPIMEGSTAAKRIVFTLLALSIIELHVYTQDVNIIPFPNYVVEKEGVYSINKKTKIACNHSNDTVLKTANLLASEIKRQTGYTLAITSPTTKTSNSIEFKIQAIDSLGKEGYILNVLPNHVEIIACTQTGLFYGMQSLIQILPWAIEPLNKLTVKCVEIVDMPRFSYRGMLLDCSRHFFSTEFIKKLLDNLALHKINTFHWHLTDDQGWRIEIKQFPELITRAAYRNETLVGAYSKGKPQKFDGKRYGGYYTQEAIKEIVKYAGERFITIIPEIELPGHSQAAIAAYPWLGSTDESTEVATSWGIKPYLYNPFDTTFYFLEKVLSEVFELFPGEYVHIGGDEAIKDQWIANPKIQERIQELGLKDENELQSWFIRQIQKFAQSYGKKIIGWDEITEGGAPKDAAIMYWRSKNKSALEEAVKGNHPVIVTPYEYCYFNSPQDTASTEPVAWGKVLSLEKAYSFEPIPSFCSKQQAKQIMGAQACLWSEYIATPEVAEYMLFPRLAALAEVAWTNPEKKDFAEFSERLQALMNIYGIKKINYFKKKLPVYQ